MTPSIQMSQGLDVLLPKSGPAYPIPCGEWDLLKDQARRFSSEPWFFHTIGSTLLGSAAATWISILLGTFESASADRARTVAWAVTAVSAISGGLALTFAHLQRKVRAQQASDLARQMELIEQRYERPAA